MLETPSRAWPSVIHSLRKRRPVHPFLDYPPSREESLPCVSHLSPFFLLFSRLLNSTKLRARRRAFRLPHSAVCGRVRWVPPSRRAGSWASRFIQRIAVTTT